MGEYATRIADGERIKIGTCEDLMYLRPDQIATVRVEGGRLAAGDLTPYLFRFPFPDEDRAPPGDFRDSHREVGLSGVDVHDGVEHGRTQFASTWPKGHLVTLPCPLSAEGKATGLTFQRNGYSGDVRIVQQRVWDGVWVLVAKCGGCNNRYRLPTLADAQPIIDAARRYAIGEQHRDPGQAAWWHKVADRIEGGYTTPAGTAQARKV